MNIKFNPMMTINDHDICYMKKARQNIENMFCAIDCHTMSDNGFISCADNGEVIITKDEAEKVYEILSRVLDIYESAPKCDNPRFRRLAVDFEN